MGHDKVYSNRLNQGLIEYLDAKFGKTITNEVLARIHLDRLTVTDPSGFATAEVTHDLNMAAIELTGEKKIAYLIGRDLPNSIGILGGFIAGVTSPQIFMKSLGQIEGRLALKTINKTTRVGRNRYRVEITYKDGFLAKHYVCDNRVGCYESAPLFFGLPYAKVEHPQCVHRNEGNCVYIVDFPEYGFLWFKRAAQFIFASAFAWMAVSWLGGLKPSLPSVPGILVIGALICFSLYKHLAAKKSLEWSLMTNEGLAKQNQLLERMHSKVVSLRNLTASLVESRGPADACPLLVRGLVKEMGFGSAQVWLLNGQEGSLSCEAADGYQPEMLKIIMETRFNTGEEEGSSHGPLTQTLEQRKTVIVNEINDFLPRVSRKSRDFISALNLSSFIMTPLFHGDIALGILAGGNHSGERIENQDQLIFESLAHVLAATIIKAGRLPLTENG